MSNTTKRPLESTTSTSKKEKKSERPRPTDKWILLADCVETRSPELYLVRASRETLAPHHMLKRLFTGDEYTSLYEGMSADEMSGLVDEDGEDPEDRAEEILDWLRSMCTKQNLLAAGKTHQIDVIMSLVEK